MSPHPGPGPGSGTAPAGPPPGARRFGAVASGGAWVLLLGLVAVWAVTLRPVALGGPATLVGVHGESMLPTLESGDLVVVRRADVYRVGDPVAYRVPAGEPGAGNLVVHRIVGVAADGTFTMRGDNNSYDDVWRPQASDVQGRVWVRLPGVATAARQLTEPGWFAASVGLLALVVLGLPRDHEASTRRRPGGGRRRARPVRRWSRAAP